MTTQEHRTERIHIRTDVAFKERLEHAAELVNQTVSEFVRTSVEDRAEEVISSQRMTLLAPEDFDALLAALDAPPISNEPTRRAARRYSSLTQS